MDNNLTGEIALILLGIIMAIILIPLGGGIIIARFIGFTGFTFYGFVILFSVIIWVIFGLIYFKK